MYRFHHLSSLGKVEMQVAENGAGLFLISLRVPCKLRPFDLPKLISREEEGTRLIEEERKASARRVVAEMCCSDVLCNL